MKKRKKISYNPFKMGVVYVCMIISALVPWNLGFFGTFSAVELIWRGFLSKPLGVAIIALIMTLPGFIIGWIIGSAWNKWGKKR